MFSQPLEKFATVPGRRESARELISPPDHRDSCDGWTHYKGAEERYEAKETLGPKDRVVSITDFHSAATPSARGAR